MLAAQKGGISKDYWEKECGFEKVHENPFDSERKLMSTVYKVTNPSLLEHFKPTNLVLVKGAPEELLRKCTHRLPEASTLDNQFDLVLGQKEGCKPVELTDDFIDKVSEQSSRMASRGLRVLGFAFKSFKVEDEFPFFSSSSSPGNDGDGDDKNNDADNNKNDNNDDNMNNDEDVDKIDSSADRPASQSNSLYSENNLTFVGLIGLIDPPKKAVKESVQRCKEAGIRVVMITGDHVATATAIATEIGIIEPDVPQMVSIT